MRYFWVIINTIFWTTTLGAIGILSSIFESKKGKMLGACAQIWAKLILRIGGVSYSVEGLDNLDKNKSYVFAGNHASGFDILLAYATLPFWIVSIAKIELRSIFFLGFVMKSAGHIFVDRNNHEKAIKSLNEAKRSLFQNPRSILLYPEGTRSLNGSIRKFKPGGLILGAQLGLSIVPIYYSGTFELLKKGSFKIKRNQKIKLKIGHPVKVKDYDYSKRRELAKLIENKVIELSKGNK